MMEVHSRPEQASGGVERVHHCAQAWYRAAGPSVSTSLVAIGPFQKKAASASKQPETSPVRSAGVCDTITQGLWIHFVPFHTALFPCGRLLLFLEIVSPFLFFFYGRSQFAACLFHCKSSLCWVGLTVKTVPGADLALSLCVKSQWWPLANPGFCVSPPK